MLVPPLLDDLIAGLRQPVHGTAQLAGDGRLTVGVHTTGGPAGWPLLVPGGRTARHATIVGAAGSGKSVLLRSILAAARTAGVDGQVIDAHEGSLTGLGFPAACSIAAARTVLAEQHELARHRQATGEHPLRLLLVENLHLLTRDRRCAEQVGPLLVDAGPAQIAVIAGTQLAHRPVFGRPAPHPAKSPRSLLTENLVLLRTGLPLSRVLPVLDDTLSGLDLPDIASQFTDGATTAGIGYLPRRSGLPFRAWWS